MSELSEQPPFIYPAIEGDRKKTEYFMRTISGSWSGYKYSSWNNGQNSSTEEWSGTVEIVYSKNHETGEVAIQCTGSHSWSEVQTFPVGPPLVSSANWTLTFDGSNFVWNGGGIYQQKFPIGTPIPGWPYPTNDTVITSDISDGLTRTIAFDQHVGGSSGPVHGNGTCTISLADPVVDNYPGTFSDPVLAIALGAFPDAVKYDLKWRIRHDPTFSAYLKVWLQKNDGYSATAISPYIWSGSGNPCLNNAFLPPDDPANTIYGGLSEEPAPAGGILSVEISRFSFLPDYTPPEDGSADGWPNIG